MKRHIIVRAKQVYAAMVTLVLSSLISIHGSAQDKKVDINVNTKSDNGGNFFMQPWVWIVGGAIFILLLVALLRSNRSKD